MINIHISLPPTGLILQPWLIDVCYVWTSNIIRVCLTAPQSTIWPNIHSLGRYTQGVRVIVSGLMKVEKINSQFATKLLISFLCFFRNGLPQIIVFCCPLCVLYVSFHSFSGFKARNFPYSFMIQSVGGLLLFFLMTTL